MTNTGFNERTSILVTDTGLRKLQNAKVLIAGLGGVGSYVAEALARAGIGNLKLIDNDVVSKSNINRQLVALHSTVGLKKTQVMFQRIKDINPDCNIELIEDFIRPDDMDTIFCEDYSFVVDAIDSLSCKVSFVRTAFEKNYNIISSMGAGGKIDPTKIVVTDLFKTIECKLARKMRIRLRRQGIKKGILAVYSTEKPIAPLPPEPVACETDRERAVNGTISYLPALFGLTIAGVVTQKLIKNHLHTR